MFEFPNGSLIVLAGTSGVGKTTWAGNFFSQDQIVSADRFRWMISGDEGDQSVTPQAWEMANSLICHRLSLGNTTVVDSLALQARARESLIGMARQYSAPAYIIQIWADLDECLRGQQTRQRKVPEDVVRRMFVQAQQLRELILAGGMEAEGFSGAQVLERN